MKQQFPDLIKSGLKVGDKVYSYLYGDGKVISIENDLIYPIGVQHKRAYIKYTSLGQLHRGDLIPSITLTPWNPVAGEPFPFPKFEPITGEWYAFWDDDDNGFRVHTFGFISDEGRFVTCRGYRWDNCAPISEAMEIFGVKQYINTIP